jgi:hypothetical protein
VDYTRVDSKKLAAAVAKVLAALKQADESLDELTVILTPQERTDIPKPKDGFETVARAVANNADLSELKLTVGYESDAVLEDLANVELVDALTPPLAKLGQRVTDSRLVWLGEALGMNLELYGVAKARAKHDATIAHAIEPLVTHLSTPRLGKK